MASLIQEALAYEPPKTLNVADLPLVSTDVQIYDREGKDGDGKPFKYKVIELNGEEYRIPGSVLSSLKSILEEKPTLKTFKVKKEGSGLNTKYTVVPIE